MQKITLTNNRNTEKSMGQLLSAQQFLPNIHMLSVKKCPLQTHGLKSLLQTQNNGGHRLLWLLYLGIYIRVPGNMPKIPHQPSLFTHPTFNMQKLVSVKILSSPEPQFRGYFTSSIKWHWKLTNRDINMGFAVLDAKKYWLPLHSVNFYMSLWHTCSGFNQTTIGSAVFRICASGPRKFCLVGILVYNIIFPNCLYHPH